MSGLIPPKIELDQAFMPVLVTSNFDDDSTGFRDFKFESVDNNGLTTDGRQTIGIL